MGLQVPLNRDRGNTFVPDNTVERLPKSIDYRKKGMVTPVKNQVRLLRVPLQDSCCPVMGSFWHNEKNTMW